LDIGEKYRKTGRCDPADRGKKAVSGRNICFSAVKTGKQRNCLDIYPESVYNFSYRRFCAVGTDAVFKKIE
jgi:hypothetical protein